MPEQTSTATDCPRLINQSDSAGRLMKSILVLMRAEIDRRMVAVGLTDAQWMPVLLLATGEAHTAAGLARNCLQTPGGMTRMLDRLEAKGLIQRLRSRDDRRVVNLALTDEGQRCAQQIPEILNGVNAQALEGLMPHEVEQLKGYLKRMLATVENNMPAPGAGAD